MNDLFNFHLFRADPTTILFTENFKDTVIDPFDAYGNELYNSHFSRLVKIRSEDKETAFFHYDTNTIYFVNEQGRLDASIVLFDRYIRHPNYSHMLTRIKPVVDAYFNFDRTAAGCSHPPEARGLHLQDIWERHRSLQARP